METSNETLYQRVLGDGFTHLPPVLRDFHGSPQGGQARGTVQVQYGAGLARRTLARLLRLPPEGENVTVDLQVQTQENREIWVRHFDGVPVQTTQWQSGSLLIEKAGPLCFAFCVSNDAETLSFDFAHNEIAGFKILFPILKVNAKARGVEDGWHITVDISAPLLGVLAEYRGEITPC